MSNRSVRQSDESFAAVLVGHGSRLSGVAHRILHDHQLAEDAVAECFLKAWTKRSQLRDERKLGPWLTTICKREALRIRRRFARSPRAASEALEGQPARDERAYRFGLLDRLPKELRASATMFFVEGRSYSEIASIEGLPLSTIRGRIHLSRKRLKKEIEMNVESAAVPGEPGLKKLRARNGRIAWRGCKARLLGVCWASEGKVYNAAGVRHRRMPAALTTTTLMDYRLSFDGRERGDHLALFWQIAGGADYDLIAVARTGSAKTATPLASGAAGHDLDGRRVAALFCAPSDGTEHISVTGEIWGEAVREDDQCVRVDMKHATSTALSRPGWAVTVIGPRKGKKKETSNVVVSFSRQGGDSPVHVFGVHDNGSEARGVVGSGGCTTCVGGHLRSEEWEIDVPPDKLAALIIRPRHHVTIDWGRVKIPPRR